MEKDSTYTSKEKKSTKNGMSILNIYASNTRAPPFCKVDAQITYGLSHTESARMNLTDICRIFHPNRKIDTFKTSWHSFQNSSHSPSQRKSL